MATDRLTAEQLTELENDGWAKQGQVAPVLVRALIAMARRSLVLEEAAKRLLDSDGESQVVFSANLRLLEKAVAIASEARPDDAGRKG